MAAFGGDHTHAPPKDMSKLEGSDRQSWNSGGTAHILPAERQKATFEIKKLTNMLFGGEENVRRRRFILAPGKKNRIPELQKYNMSREEMMSAHFRDFINIHKSFTKKAYKPTTQETMWMMAHSMNSGALTMHMGLFLPTLVAQTSTSQQIAWVPKALKFEIIGSYAATELGHGSNVRGYQSTAEYDPSTQEFVLNTPTLQSMKWWNSGVGTTATHCTFYAQLRTKGRDHGVHVFFVQLRDENHCVLPGIEVGDVGNKLGDNGVDTGYIRMKNVRIPRQHMLAKKSHVDPDGTYVKHVNPAAKDSKQLERISYMTMLTARSNMIGAAAGKLGMAVTTAVRYSCVRQQGFVDTSSNVAHTSAERQIIDYQVQAYRLMKQLATCYAIQFAADFIIEKFNKMSAGLFKTALESADEDEEPVPDSVYDDLPELHASSSGLKGLCCWLAADGMEDCRKCCGGHGYLLASGIAHQWADYAWQATAEGDPVVMLLQTARFLVKMCAAARAGESLPGSIGYLAELKDASFDPLRMAPISDASLSLDTLVQLLRRRALVSVFSAEKMLSARKASGISPDAAWLECGLALRTAAERHCTFFMMLGLANACARAEDPNVKAVLTAVARLYGLSQLTETGGWAGVASAEALQAADVQIAEVLAVLRPNAVALVDALDIPDRVLNSALGRSDGNVYEAIYEHARDSPMNEMAPFKGYTKTLRPHLDLKFLALRQKPHSMLKNAKEFKPKKPAKL